MIEDFDPEPAPNRRGHVLVISLLLLVGVVAGYAAVSSPELRGPYATPRPSAVHAPAARFTPAPVASLAPSSNTLGWSFVCVAPGSAGPTSIFVLGSNVTVTPPTGRNVTVSLPISVSNPCPAFFWGQPPSPIEDRLAP